MRAANVTWAGISLHDVKSMDFTPHEFEIYRLQAGDILLAEASGSPSEVGKPAVWREDVPGACFQNTLIRVRTRERLLIPFLFWHLRNDALNGAFAHASRGVGIHHLGSQTLEVWPIRLPPLAEQQRIVAEIEKLFTRLDEAVATLTAVQTKLKRARASILKAAIEGRLVPTEAELARAEDRSYEPASALLERILDERRARRPKGKKYQPPAEPKIDDLPELPEGWTWATWAQTGISQNGRPFPSSQYQFAGVRLLRPGNLFASGAVEWNDSNTRRLPREWATKCPELLLDPGELVMNLTAQSLKDEFLGRICMTGPGESALLNQRLARLTPLLLDRRYVLWLFKSSWFRAFVQALNTGSLIQHMFTSQLAAFIFPLPPLAEQARIVAEVERRLSVIDNLEHTVEQTLARCDRLRQSILKRAFEGKLVPQDPADEPASRLLERIRDAAGSTDRPSGRQTSGSMRRPATSVRNRHGR